MQPDEFEPVPVAPPSRRRRLVLGAIALALVAGLVAMAWPSGIGSPLPSAAASGQGGLDQVTLLTGAPASIDPAHHGDFVSAAFVSHMYETLTTVDSTLRVQPALAESWIVADDGRKVTFTLRPDLQFSDGTPLTAKDVVHSWQRLFVPRDPSPLASLFADVTGARQLLAGSSADPSMLGVRAEDDRTVAIDLERGGGDLPTIVSSSPFAIVPPSAGDGEITPDPGNMVVSGGHTLERVEADRFVLRANPHYWGGTPPIETLNLVTTLNGASPVDEFVAGSLDVVLLDYTDASWIAFDRDLGPSLRTDPSLTVTYYGFDTTRPPFDDVRVRQAFAQAIDWRRLQALDSPGSTLPATSMIPAGVPGTPEGDYLPRYDPAGARALLAEAGFPGGQGLAPISFVTSGGGYDEAVVAMLEENLDVSVDFATMDFATYQERLATDPPDIWNLSWVADYPGPNDFLGVLLGSGSTANTGGWSNAEFDAAISEATSSSSSPEQATAAYAKALEIVRDQVPVVPVSYGTSYSLVRDGLLGATRIGTGLLRTAGLAWKDNP